MTSLRGDVLPRDLTVPAYPTSFYGSPTGFSAKSIGSATKFLLPTQTTARSAADGYTLFLVTSSTMSINDTLYIHLPYDPEKGLRAAVAALLDPVCSGCQQRSAD
jgi:hypothetical protein